MSDVSTVPPPGTGRNGRCASAAVAERPSSAATGHRRALSPSPFNMDVSNVTNCKFSGYGTWRLRAKAECSGSREVASKIAFVFSGTTSQPMLKGLDSTAQGRHFGAQGEDRRANDTLGTGFHSPVSPLRRTLGNLNGVCC